MGNESEETEWHAVARVDALPEGARLVVEVSGQAVALLHVDGAIYGISNLCPHAYGPLEGGFVEDGRISCPWHGWSFPLDIEQAKGDSLPRYRVKVEDGQIYIATPALFPDPNSAF